jgi:hypothetical protein
VAGDGSHITEVLGGRFIAPPGHDERHELERVKGYLQAVASCYRSLSGRETDEGRRAELLDQVRRSDEAVQRLGMMSREERGNILRVAPGLLQQLRAEIDG